MNNPRQIRSANRKSMAGALIIAFLTLVLVASFIWVYRNYYTEATFYISGNYLFYAMYSFMMITFMSVYSGYKIRQFRTRELVFSLALATSITNVISYFVMCLIARDMLSVYGVFAVTVAQWFLGTGIYVAARMLMPLTEPPVPMIYVRSDAEDDRPDRIFDSRRSSFHIDAAIEPPEDFDELHAALEGYQAVLIGTMSQRLRNELIGYCFRTGREALLLPSMKDVLLCSAAPVIMGDSLVYNLKTEGEERTYRVIKRAVDVLASLTGLIVLSPLMLAVALAIKLQDGGPVFYRQTRLTRGGQRFELIKFRSMIVNAEKNTGAVLAGKGDSRITPVGRFIRATRIDELPQLWNILRGDMTLVGPRPERPEFYETICKEYPAFEYRLKVKAGLTGYAQLYGKYNTTFAEKARLDMYYILHASPLWDLQLIFYTLKIIFIRDSTEGVDQAKHVTAAEKSAEE